MKVKQSSIITLQDIKRLWNIVRKNWWIVVLFLALALVLANIYLYKQTVIYSASTQILLKSNDQYNPSSVISDNYSYYGGTSRTFVDNSNEKRVIKSFNLIEKTLGRLDFDVSYYIVGRLKTSEQFTGIPFKLSYTSISPELLEQRLNFKILDVKRYQVTYTKKNVEQSKIGYFDADFVDTDFKIYVKKTNFINPGTIKSLTGIEYQVQIHNHNRLINQYLNSIDVENPDYTNILEVSVTDPIPERAVMFLDTLSKVYIENTLQSAIDINANTLLYIEKQMAEVTTFLNDIEDTMQMYKEDQNILDLNREGDSYFQKLTEYDNQKSSLQLQISSLNDLEKYIIEEKDPEFLPPSIYIASDDAFLKASASELYGMQVKRNEALSSATEVNQSILIIDQRIKALRMNLLTYIGNARIALKSRITDVEKEMGNYIADIKTLPFKQRGLVTIERKLLVNEKMYEFLLQKRASTIIAKASIVPLTKVIDSPRN